MTFIAITFVLRRVHTAHSNCNRRVSITGRLNTIPVTLGEYSTTSTFQQGCNTRAAEKKHPEICVRY